jgi:hypothetical protein
MDPHCIRLLLKYVLRCFLYIYINWLNNGISLKAKVREGLLQVTSLCPTAATLQLSAVRTSDVLNHQCANVL